MFQFRHLAAVAALVVPLILVSCDDDVTGPVLPEVDPMEIPMNRWLWTWASLPVRGPDQAGAMRPAFGPEDRAYQGWHRIPGLLQRGQINPELGVEEAREFYRTMELRMVAQDPAGWAEDEFAGIMMHFVGLAEIDGRVDTQYPMDVDLSGALYLQFWIDDGTGYIDPTDEAAIRAGRPGRIHFDFGTITEDSWWKPDGTGGRVIGEWDREDLDGDGLLGIDEEGKPEDRGLDGLLDEDETEDQALYGRPSRGPSDPAGDDFDAAETGDFTYVYINGTEGNQRLDDEDLDRDGILGLADGFFRLTLELDDDRPYVDPAYAYRDNPEFIQELQDDHRSWRMYRLDMRDVIALQRGMDADEPGAYSAAEPDLSKVSILRIWYEPEGDGTDPVERRIRFSEMRFVENPTY